MAGGHRFGPLDWGQDHLSLDAIVAFVDDELTDGPHERAKAHIDLCRECRVEVVAQRQARTALRRAGGPCLPSSLLRSLRSIPVEAELPPPPPGLGITADGQFVLLRDVPRTVPEPHDLPGSATPRRFSRRARVGAVSGLALGALAVGALAVPAQPLSTGTAVVGGTLLNGSAQARMSPSSGGPVVIPAVVPATDPTVGASPQPAATAQDPTVAPTDGALDAAWRARLDGAPIAFHHSP